MKWFKLTDSRSIWKQIVGGIVLVPVVLFVATGILLVSVVAFNSIQALSNLQQIFLIGIKLFAFFGAALIFASIYVWAREDAGC